MLTQLPARYPALSSPFFLLSFTQNRDNLSVNCLPEFGIWLVGRRGFFQLLTLLGSKALLCLKNAGFRNWVFLTFVRFYEVIFLSVKWNILLNYFLNEAFLETTFFKVDSYFFFKALLCFRCSQFLKWWQRHLKKVS